MQKDPWEDIGKIEEFKIRNRIRKILAENKDIFAWSQDGLPGVDSNLVENNLNINTKVKLVRQKLKPLGLERRKAVLEEILKLKKSGFGREVQYPK